MREGVDLPSNFTATVNAEMKVGALEETINVSGTASQVDVQQATRTTVIARDVIDSLPISRNVMGLAVIVPGVRPGTPDMGGVQTTEQVGLRARGLGGLDGDQLVEGMSIQSYEGTSLSFLDDTLQAEMTVSTAAIPADTGGGGIRLNSILKDGGNNFSGSAFMGGTKGTWVKDNIDDGCASRGLNVANGIDHLESFTGSLGGPILRDRLWWILSARHQSTETTIANVPKFVTAADGTQYKATNDLYVRSLSTRLTWQASEKIQSRWVSRALVAQEGPFDYRRHRSPCRRAARPAKRAPRDRQHEVDGARHQQMVDRGGLVLCRVLLEGRQPLRHAGRDRARLSVHAGVVCDGAHKRYSAQPQLPRQVHLCASAGAERLHDLERHARAAAGERPQRGEVHGLVRDRIAQHQGGHRERLGSGPPAQEHAQRPSCSSGTSTISPSTVEVFNNPVIQPAYVAYDVGIFAQDSWTIKRLTINPGLRVQWVETGMYESSMAAGRFAPARFIEEERGLIDFGADYSPRFSAVYDLFGDGRTALKTSWSKYYRNYDGDIAANAYGRAGERSEMRTWLDRNLVAGTNTPTGAAATVLCPGVRVLPTDCDGVAQDNEIGTSPSGGAFANPDRPDRKP